MLLDFLRSLPSGEAFTSAKSFFDLSWRNKAFYVSVQSPLLESAEGFQEGVVVSSDALHFLNILRKVERASIEEFVRVMKKLKGEWGREEAYVRYHLRMYAESFVMMRILEAGVEDIVTKTSNITFVPVLSSSDNTEYKFLEEGAKSYEVSPKDGRGGSQNYISLGINDGFMASQGRDGEPEMMSYGF